MQGESISMSPPSYWPIAKNKYMGTLKYVGTASIVNRRGLHARAAAKLASVAGRFKVCITVSANGVSAEASSIMSLMLLAAGPGDVLQFEGTGSEAERVIPLLVALVEAGFEEDHEGVNQRQCEDH